jgi:hypothetical protein
VSRAMEGLLASIELFQRLCKLQIRRILLVLCNSTSFTNLNFLIQKQLIKIIDYDTPFYDTDKYVMVIHYRYKILIN